MHPSRPFDGNRPSAAKPTGAPQRDELPRPAGAGDITSRAKAEANGSASSGKPAAKASAALSREDRRVRSGMEIAALSQQDLSPGEYFTNLLPMLIDAIPGVGAAVWAKDDNGQPRRVLEHEYPAGDLTANPQVAGRHRQLLSALLEQSEPALVLPGEGGRRAEGPANLSSLRLLLLPLFGAGKSEALVEICQQSEQALTDGPGEDPAFEDLEFARQMCELAGDFLRAHTLRQLRAPRQTPAPVVAPVVPPATASQVPPTTATELAAAARSITAAERAMVLTGSPDGMRLVAYDAAPTSSANVRRVPLATELARRVVTSAQDGDSLAPGSARPSEVDELVTRYCHDTGAKAVTVRRVTSSPTSDPDGSASDVAAVLLIEHGSPAVLEPTQRQALDALVRQGWQALQPGNAPATRSPSPSSDRPFGWRLTAQLAGRSSRQLAFLAAGLLLIGVALAPVPAEFSASAVLRPSRTQWVRSEVNGTVRQLHVHQSDDVAAGDPLLVLDSWELEQQSAQLAGELAAAEQRLTGLEQGLLDDTGESSGDRNRLASDAAAAAAEVAALRSQWELLRRQQSRLTVVSPASGRVLTKNTERELLNRPVKRGDVLLEIADPAGPWQLDIPLPPESLRQVASLGAGGQAVILRYQSALADDGWQFARVTEIRPADDATVGGSVHALAAGPSCSLSRGSLPAEVRIRRGYRPLIYVLLSRAWQ